jgi:hypothetical protein
MMGMAAMALSGAETKPKFTVDQCRVLKQVGVDTREICPQPKPPVKKRTRMKR